MRAPAASVPHADAPPVPTRREVARAEVALVAAQLALWTRPAGRLVRPSAPADPPSADPAAVARARRLAAAVDRAAARSVLRPTCLARALALHRLLAREGLGGAIRIGVAPDRGRFGAHAWVELGGAGLGDDGARAAAFHPLAAAVPAPGRRGP